MRQPLITLFGKSLTRLIATAHLCILTDRELIIIRDDEDSPVWQPGVRYGGVWLYLPLAKIVALAVTPRTADVLTLTIELPHGERIESLFATAQQAEVDRFLCQVAEWAPDAALKRQDI